MSFRKEMLDVDVNHNDDIAWLKMIYFFFFGGGKVYLILDEFILAGELQETSKRVCFPIWTLMEHIIFFATIY